VSVKAFRSKNGERRTIPVNNLVLDVLKRKAKVRSLKSDYVFPSDTFTLLDDSHLRRAFRGATNLVQGAVLSGLARASTLASH